LLRVPCLTVFAMPRHMKTTPAADDSCGDALNWLSGKVRMLEGKVASQNDLIGQLQSQVAVLSKIFLFIDVDDVSSKLSACSIPDGVAVSSHLLDVVGSLPGLGSTSSTSPAIAECKDACEEGIGVDARMHDEFDIHSEVMDSCELECAIDWEPVYQPTDESEAHSATECELDSVVDIVAIPSAVELDASSQPGDSTEPALAPAATLDEMLQAFAEQIDNFISPAHCAAHGLDFSSTRTRLLEEFKALSPNTLDEVKAFLENKVLSLFAGPSQMEQQLALAQARLEKLEVSSLLQSSVPGSSKRTRGRRNKR